MIGKPDKTTLEGWTTIAVLASITIRIKLVTPVRYIISISYNIGKNCCNT